MLDKRQVIAKTEKTLSFMRCFEECVSSFNENRSLPLPLCYQCKRSLLKIDHSFSSADSNIYLFDVPVDSHDSYAQTLNNFEYLNSNRVLDKNVIDYLITNNCIRVNELGKWILITEIKFYTENVTVKYKPPLWLLKHRFGHDDQLHKFLRFPKRSSTLLDE